MPDTLIDVPALMAMSQAELDATFRESPAGDIPAGEAEGTVLVAPGTALTGIAAKLIHLLAWKGKVFDADRGELRNEVLLTGIHAVQAKVYKDASWYDGQECIVLDYSAHVAHRALDPRRDAPGRPEPLPGDRVLGSHEADRLRAAVPGRRRRMSATEMWAPQTAVTVIAEVREGRGRALERLLHSMGDGVSNERVIAFGDLAGVHFARLVLVPPVDPRDASTLILMSDVDGAQDDHLAELADSRARAWTRCSRTAAGIRRCRRAPPGGSPSCAPGRCAPTRATSTGRDAPSPRCATRPGCATRSRPTSTRPAPSSSACSALDARAQVQAFVAGDPALAVRRHARAGAGARRARALRARLPAAAGDAARALAASRRRGRALDRAAAHPRAPRPGPGHPPRPGRRRADRRPRGSRRAELVHRRRPGQAGPVPAPDLDRAPVGRRLGDAASVRACRPGRGEDDPLRPLGVPRRQEPPGLREQLRRQPRERTWATSSTRWRGA